jgi:hypothetical protein
MLACSFPISIVEISSTGLRDFARHVAFFLRRSVGSSHLHHSEGE